MKQTHSSPNSLSMSDSKHNVRTSALPWITMACDVPVRGGWGRGVRAELVGNGGCLDSYNELKSSTDKWLVTGRWFQLAV